MKNDSCFWAVSVLASVVIAAIFLVLFIFLQLPAAFIGIWIAAAVSVLILVALLLQPYKPSGLTATQAAPPQSPCCCWVRPNCCARWIGAIAGAAATIGFGAAFLSTTLLPASVTALVFYFLAVLAFSFELIAIVGYAACRCNSK